MYFPPALHKELVSKLVERMEADAFAVFTGCAETPKEQPKPCPKCGPVLKCSEHLGT